MAELVALTVTPVAHHVPMDRDRPRKRCSTAADPSLGLSLPARRVLAEYHEFGLALGKPVRARTAAVVLASGQWLTGRMPCSWSGDDLVAMAWYGVVAWCRAADVEVPDDAAAAVRLFGDYLDPCGRRGLGDAIDGVVDPVALTARPRATRTG